MRMQFFVSVALTLHEAGFGRPARVQIRGLVMKRRSALAFAILWLSVHSPITSRAFCEVIALPVLTSDPSSMNYA